MFIKHVKVLNNFESMTKKQKGSKKMLKNVVKKFNNISVNA